MRTIWAQNGHTDYLKLWGSRFHFNHRRSNTRGLLFYRLAQQAVAIGPAPFEDAHPDCLLLPLF